MKLRKIDLSESIDIKYGLADDNLQTEGVAKKENFKTNYLHLNLKNSSPTFVWTF